MPFPHAALTGQGLDFNRNPMSNATISKKTSSNKQANYSSVVVDADKTLAGISKELQFPLSIFPTNFSEVWEKFRHHHYEQVPIFRFADSTQNIDRLQKHLDRLPLDDIEDARLQTLFQDKQLELDRLLSLRMATNGDKFIHFMKNHTLPLTEKHYKSAKSAFLASPEHFHTRANGQMVRDRELSYEVRREMKHYQRLFKEFPGQVEIRSEIPWGITVIHDLILIARDTTLPPKQVSAALHRTIGVHLVSFFNGLQHPLQLMSHGLPGAAIFRAGVGVLGEYLSKGIHPTRLRTMSARIIALDEIDRGAEFTDIFRLLHKEWHFSPKESFLSAVMTHTCGGVIPETLELIGFMRVIEYLKSGGNLESLWSGNTTPEHMTWLHQANDKENQGRPLLLPRFLHGLNARERLEQLYKSKTLEELLPG